MQFTDYLIEQSGATAEQVDDLRSKAQARGRSLLDQAYLSGLINERDLLRAIQSATNSATVELGRRKIDPSVLWHLTGRKAWSLKLLPFALDRKKNILSVACLYPIHQKLHENLAAIFPEQAIKLFATIGPILEAAIIEHYRSEPLTGNSREFGHSETGHSGEPDPNAKLVFLIGAQTNADRQLGQALVSEGYRVIMADDWSDLTEELASGPPDLVLIRESADDVGLSGANKIVPPELPASTVIRRYESVSRLLDPSQDVLEHSSLAMANLHLATEALARTLDTSIEIPIQIGLMVEKICQQLRLAPHDHLITVTAGYLQDIAALHFKGEESSDRQTAYFMLQGLIDESDVYPPAVLGVIRKMYCDLVGMKPSEANSIETRNANILTVVDFYRRQFPDQAKITPRRFDLIDQKIRNQIGRLILPEVAESFFSLMRSEITHKGKSDSTNRALVLDELGIIDQGLAGIISESNLALSLTNSIEQFSAQYQKRLPDLLIITSGDNAFQIDRTFQKLISDGVVFGSVPSFLLHTSTEFDKIAILAKYGLDHSILYAGEFEILKFRLKQIADDKEQESRRRLKVLQEMGTHGSLADMNIIDLLQSMGPSNKTLCISVSGKAHNLTMYLTQGQLIHAASDDHDGVEAVYQALKWESGIWSVDHVTREDLPEPNVQQSIDSILMQGCYLLDELNRGQSISQEIKTHS